MMYKIHELKTWTEYFNQIAIGLKTFELRKNDRDFKIGDTLILHEWNPETEQFTGRKEWRRVGYILQGDFGLPSEMCVMSLLPFR